MSAPDVTLERQKHRHRKMVRGIWIGVGIIALVSIGAYVAVFGFGADLQEAVPPEL
ncbi:hypothetical protein [Roseobacter denitrificans]|uniref:Uncharacterized protein n=1 Tax=Roseobacter denitrificans (strain ATCC 33942 / OCh 114) TaxID=375451 RepID=Q163L8_ROSDO|nr:hypothetical protein [Roseobacter denitrificans]ABG32825.1 hypothetical protein RD1_3326 [Roseobacter denitrificans OCh 114]SFF95401.1 hypothetical protein SAMN05443635_104238 [Roseobacter denitrificans OCh 114]